MLVGVMTAVHGSGWASCRTEALPVLEGAMGGPQLRNRGKRWIKGHLGDVKIGHGVLLVKGEGG